MSATSQAYLNTRVTAMSTRLLEREQIQTLAQLSLPELAERFQLESVLDEQLPKQTKSRAVEQTLIRVLLAELAVLVRPMTRARAGPAVGLGSQVRAV